MKTGPSRGEIFDKLDKKTEAYLAASENCAQTAFLVLQEQFELNDGAILKALTPFPGGIALRGETCGVVVGCLLALGLVYGGDRPGDLVGYYNTLSPATKFCSRFAKEFGATTCRDIIKSDFRRLFNSIHSKKISKISATEHRVDVVCKGVRIAAELILEKEEF